jgi:iron complex transport system substrate-binding protein
MLATKTMPSSKAAIAPKLMVAAVIAAAFAGSVALRQTLGRPMVARGEVAAETAAKAACAPPCKRIVSLSPSTTEILFALGVGERVVGVSRYCRFPPEAQKRTNVGGFLDPNYEVIFALNPDLVVLRGEDDSTKQAFERLGVRTLPVLHDSIDGILTSIRDIGQTCGVEAEARRMTADLEANMRRMERKTAGLARPRVMIVAERALGEGRIEDVYIAGQGGFLDRLIHLAGGQNACGPSFSGFPVVSKEGIFKMNPEVIVDLIARERQNGHSQEQLAGEWRQLAQVAAVAGGRVHIVDDDFAFIPGPRFMQFVDRLARLIHPEVDWTP